MHMDDHQLESFQTAECFLNVWYKHGLITNTLDMQAKLFSKGKSKEIPDRRDRGLAIEQCLCSLSCKELVLEIGML